MLAIRDLQHRKGRVVVVALLMGIIITLLFVMTGMVNQFNTEPYLAAERIGDERSWVIADASTGPLTSAVPVSPAVVESIDGAVPFVIGLASLDGIRANVVGRPDIGSQPEVTDGRYPSAAGEILVDDSTGHGVGDVVSLGGRPATVVGITTDATVLAGIPLVFADVGFAQTVVAGGEPLLTGALVDGVPSSVPDGMRLMTAEEVGDDGLVPLLNAIDSVDLVRGLLWLITLIVVAAVIFITAIERTRDFAVLKAVGATDRSLALSLILQGVLMALLAVAVASVLQLFIAPQFPMPVRVPGRAFWQIPLVATFVAVVAGVAGARKAATTPAAEAFE